jgi:hypothetical protein
MADKLQSAQIDNAESADVFPLPLYRALAKTQSTSDAGLNAQDSAGFYCLTEVSASSSAFRWIAPPVTLSVRVHVTKPFFLTLTW